MQELSEARGQASKKDSMAALASVAPLKWLARALACALIMVHTAACAVATTECCAV